MKVPMGPPPPPQNPNPSETDPNLPKNDQINLHDQVQANQNETLVAEWNQPPPENPNSGSGEAPDAISRVSGEEPIKRSTTHNAPYTIPAWSDPPSQPYFVEVVKDGTIVEQIDVSGKGAYMFGRIDQCDFVLEHPSISRFHAVLQFKNNGEAFLYDLGSTHGTFVNKGQVKHKVYKELHVGDVIRFGHSSRLYLFQGPSELMPPEGDLKKVRDTKIRAELQDCEASLSRARIEASMADGISWGMTEDAIEESAEDEVDEVTWQTYKGQLTEKQEKTREKIIKRTEKVANMKKEIDAIQAKEIAQGGLTQGQQTQIARNEQRISQIMDELESLEETLNESIQESIGARAGKVSCSKKKGFMEDEDEVGSDDDEFYDRTKKPSVMKAGEQPVETADTLLDKKETIIKEMDDIAKLLLEEKNKMAQKTEGDTEGADALDAYMNGLSSQFVLDVTTRLQKKLGTLQSKLDRIQYLLKIADPTGEAAQRRDSKPQLSNSSQQDTSASCVTRRPPLEKNRSGSEKPSVNGSLCNEENSQTSETNKPPKDDKNLNSKTPESKMPGCTVPKPRWLGATQDMESERSQEQKPLPSLEESGPCTFVDFKDRKKVLGPIEDAKKTTGLTIEDAASGLILRKRKQVENPGIIAGEDNEVMASSSVADTTAEDGVALLLKHKRGLFASDDEGRDESHRSQVNSRTGKEDRKSRKVLGPEKPAFLDGGSDYESWVPPQGQTGDGRTSLNDRYGY